MTPTEALASATTTAAALLGKERELGAVAPGYDSDIVAVEGDPLKDVGVVIDHDVWVMKGGAVVFDKTRETRQEVALGAHATGGIRYASPILSRPPVASPRPRRPDSP